MLNYRIFVLMKEKMYVLTLDNAVLGVSPNITTLLYEIKRRCTNDLQESPKGYYSVYRRLEDNGEYCHKTSAGITYKIVSREVYRKNDQTLAAFIKNTRVKQTAGEASSAQG